VKEAHQIKKLLRECSSAERFAIFNSLRDEFAIHPLEDEWNTKAEVILEAIKRASDLTQRGVRGIIAEASFILDLVPALKRWRDITPPGDFAYDCLLEDQVGKVRVQIKMQRQKAMRPMMANEAYRFLPSDMYVVETQKTRAGRDLSGKSTRPYRFGEFDILGVCLHPSSKDWRDFVFTVSDWLIPNASEPQEILKFQPVSQIENDDWTRNFDKCADWLRSEKQKMICQGLIKYP